MRTKAACQQKVQEDVALKAKRKSSIHGDDNKHTQPNILPNRTQKQKARSGMLLELFCSKTLHEFVMHVTQFVILRVFKYI